jgi:hypothetical protein
LTRGATALVFLLAVAPCAAARAQSDDAAKERHYAAWADAPFTCRDLIEAASGKDDTEDAKGNYDAILSWESDYPSLADHRDVQNRMQLADGVMKWCNDAAQNGNMNEKLSGVVERAWRLIGK